MDNLVIGLGEVGQALRNILECDGDDFMRGIFAAKTQYDVIHIAYPYKEGKAGQLSFEDSVFSYQERFKPRITIIHSSVPIGTCDKLNAVSSPIRGVHPNLEEGIRTFVKFFGGEQAEDAAQIFSYREVPVHCSRDARSVEALKLWDTTQYGIQILLNKEIHEFCKQNKLDFNLVYRMGNETYNKGYSKLLRPEVVRPYLDYMEGRIGGHCVVPNATFLNTPSAKRIITENESLKT